MVSHGISNVQILPLYHYTCQIKFQFFWLNIIPIWYKIFNTNLILDTRHSPFFSLQASGYASSSMCIFFFVSHRIVYLSMIMCCSYHNQSLCILTADHVYGSVKNASSMGALLIPELLYIYMLASEFIRYLFISLQTHFTSLILYYTMPYISYFLVL
jgi:hypothetical protein